jgi:ferric-dicitrate binding protein FerR (iron transport regulator)
MLRRRLPSGRSLSAALIAIALIGSAVVGSEPALAGGACELVPNERNPTEKTLQCGQELTVKPAAGTRYRPLYKKGEPLPVGIQLNDGALLIEYHPVRESKFQILTPLAIAAVRGTKWAMEVSAKRTSTLVLQGSVAVTNRRLNQYVVLTEGQGVDVSEGDTAMVQKEWKQARVQALLARFGE